ncbi:hypothetical protein BHAOGJBA_4205 [Methylobacterium hispanicum]|uniref:Uncharacterized protein n=1 Tax=Methylobacterium hispanicum TaxID=270350 RepID=A0AAV4ZS00_9HYPH|nr:hypothetical protein [Methylobacterium hispanicum]GJD90663.1 hypothetical protein BHAOGJBA_4205 [Methylobacterium hispanicum]
MPDEADEIARQHVVEDVISRLHRATEEGTDYRSIFTDVARQLLDRMDAAGTAWSSPTRYEATALLMRKIVDPAAQRHSADLHERRMLYADLFGKVSGSVVSGVRADRMRAELVPDPA